LARAGRRILLVDRSEFPRDKTCGDGLTALGLHPALAFVIVAVVYLLVAAVLALVGRRQLGKAKGPRRTIETSKKSVETLKAIGKGD